MIEYPICPEYDLSCPYCLASGECIIDNPIEECDIYGYYNEEEKEINTINLLENLIEEYKKEFEAEETPDALTHSFRNGMIFAWKLAILKIKEEKEREKNEI